MAVYLDVVIVLNFLVDLLLLLGTCRLSGENPERWRVVLASVLGGIYAGACLLSGFAFLGSVQWRMITLASIALVAFGLRRRVLRLGCTFLLLSMALGGAVELMGREDAVSMLVSALVLFALCLASVAAKPHIPEYVAVEICHGDKTMEMTALVDTGNCLKDPVTGRSVLVVDSDAAYRLLGVNEISLRNPAEIISRGSAPGLRLVPYCSVGCSSGLLLAIQPDRLRINGKYSRQLVAFAPQRIGIGKNYQALAGGIAV